jgi:hypothetical protein
MNRHQRTSFVVLLLSLLSIAGCFPNFEATTITRKTVARITKIESPTKAYLLDASVVLFPEGFTVRADTIVGQGQRFWLDKSDSLYRTRYIKLDSIVAITSYESKISSGRGVGHFLLGVFGTIMTPLSIYCISCPKCCFGSCPTVYTYDDSDMMLEAELFSHSVSKLIEERDLDVLSSKVRSDNTLQLQLTNEALETHYINMFSLLAVEHPRGTKVIPSEKNDFVVIKNPQAPSSAVDREGRNVLSLIEKNDTLTYRTDLGQFSKLAERGEFDRLDFTTDVPEGTRNVKIVIRLRNTLLSTILFYDVVLGSQGISALDWNDRMNHDENYAKQFMQVYKRFSGVTVNVQRDGKWLNHCTIEDVGPIAWKDVATEIPVDKSGKLGVRLEFFPDNVMIDYVAFDFETDAGEHITLRKINPVQILDNTGADWNEILPLIQSDDDKYLVTHPGDFYHFVYSIEKSQASDLTLFVSSKGYYTEWIRGNWLRASTAAYHFDLSDIQGTISHLVQSWLQNKDEIEHKFFQSRIPVRRLK